MSLGDSAKE